MPLSTYKVTKAVKEDMEFAFRHGWNVTCVIVGGPGEGKSRAVFLLSDLWTKLTGGERKITWNISEIPELNDGDWLHIDEWLYLRGKGSKLALDALKNLYPLGRAKQICISVSTDVAPGLPFVTFEATTLAQDFDNRRNLFEIRVPLPGHGLVYIGNAIFPLSKDDERWAEYELESYRRKTDVFMEGGEQRVSFKLDNMDIAEQVIEWADGKDLIISTRGHATAALDSMAKERGLKLNYAIEETISNLIVMLIRSRAEEESSSQETKFGDFTEDWAGLRGFIEKWCLGKKPARKEYATATAMWIVPESPPLSQDDVFDLIDFGANPVKVGTLTREIRKLRKRIQRPDRAFTDFTESWVASQLDILGARSLGGQDAADIVLEGGKEVAVKFCVRNDPFYDYTVAPEKDGVVVIVIPRQLQFFVIPIKDNVVNEHLQLDNAQVRAGGV